jgi:hypothetical protein
MKTKNLLFLSLLLLLGVLKNTVYAQTCFTPAASAPFPAASPPACNNCSTFDDFQPDSTDTFAIIRINWVYTRPSTGPGVFWNCDSLHAAASVYDGTLGLNALIDTLQLPWYPHTPPAAYVPFCRVKFVLNSYKFVTDDALYYGPDMPDNSTVATATTVPPPAYLNSNGAITIIFNVDTNTFIGPNGRVPNGGYGRAGNIPSRYLNMRQHCNIGGCFVSTNVAWSNWWGNTDLMIHELGHCLGLQHTNETPMNPCLDDYFLEGFGTWTGGNNILGYNHNDRQYLSPRQIDVVHNLLVNQYNDILVNNGYFTVDHNYDINITSNTTWSYERHIKGNVTVKAGNILTINCKVSMLQDAKIIVEKGAKLLIDGGEVTNVMGRVWRGIEVEGTPTAAHLVSNVTGLCTTQGVVELKNGAVISHAWFGVFTGRTNDITMAGIPNSNGGVVIANNSSFVNNVFDVFFYQHTNSTNKSKLNNCSFITDNYVGKDKNGTTMLGPLEHVKLYKYYGVNILGCAFKYTAGSMYAAGSRGDGIYSTDANFTVNHICNNATNPCTSFTRSSFTDLTNGIRVDNFNASYVAWIENSDFYTQTGWSMIAENANNMVFMNNYVSSTQGMYINKCKYYNVRKNTFEGIGHAGNGILVNASFAGAHEIYANKIYNWGRAVNVQNDNGNTTSGLRINCNDFSYQNNMYNQYDVSLTTAAFSTIAPTVFTQQSSANVPVTATGLVRNIYGAPYMNSTIKNRWWIHSLNTQTIFHKCNSSPASTNPSPQTSPQLAVSVQPGMPLNYANDCPANPSSTGGGGNRTQRLANMNDYLISLNATNVGNKNLFQIQATVSAKLNIYFTDTMPGDIDSAIAILERNDGRMADADIMTVFAYMQKGDYTMAFDRANTLAADRADWKALLLKSITLEQADNGMYSLLGSAADAAFIENYAATENMDGQASAQAIRKLVFNQDHELPVYNPEGTGAMLVASEENDPSRKESETMGDAAQQAPGAKGGIITNEQISVYPNPVQSGITIQVAETGESILNVEIKDLLGKSVYTGTIKDGSSRYIPSGTWLNGLYIITVSTADSKVLYQNKLIKQ